MKLIAQILVSGLAVIIAAYVLPGVHVADFITAVIVAAVIALLNAFIKPVLILLTLPITILTLGLFLLVINAVIILIAGHFVRGFTVDGFWWALLFSIILSVINSFFEGQRRQMERDDK